MHRISGEKNMSWNSRRGRGGWGGPWPGRGPFSYLPPWQRPGWQYGRGACWWLYNPYLNPSVTPYIPNPKDSTQPPITELPKEEEIQMLDEQIKALETHLDAIRQRLEELKK
jgi:hypothetical protein